MPDFVKDFRSWYDPFIARPLDYETSVPVGPSITPQDDWYNQAAAQHGIAGGYATTGSCNAEVRAIDAQISNYAALRSFATGPEGTYIRWIIGDKISRLIGQREKLLGRESYYKAKPPPVPSWMQEYIEPSTPLEKSQYPYTGEPRRGRVAEGKPKASALRPIGAQAELSPEQMGLMAGYQAWGMAGSPYSFSEGAIRDMAEWRRWWEPHTRLSESQFPTKAKLGGRWATALQR